MALRRVPPETFTVAPLLDLLTAEQQQAIQSPVRATHFLAEREAIVLLGALAYGHGPRYATFRDNDQHGYAETALKRAGVLYDLADQQQVALQQRGLIRRYPGGGYLELTDDTRYGLAPDPTPPAP